MTKSNLRQRDLERIFRAANAIGASVQIDLKTLVVTVLPTDRPAIDADSAAVPFGRENWDEAISPISPPFDGRELNAMEVLFKLPDGLWTSASAIRSFGPHTQQKLLERGFIELSPHATKNSDIRITEKGRTDWALYQRFIEDHPHL
ncbi:hypothetical protein [Agrobacterium tumefaciens]|jgi:hypothetical protein|uniref:hypothetical protein n=1 Tax=Agrobacterium tumefaciens TaxID=358 RepID=UPI0015725A9D|nr:hypothetical protein [Agrobacterium tumefaciens]NTD09998.1 hypothetical protein [Agrobacterium tumefaciens]